MTASLGDILTFAGVPERISNPASERFVTVRLRGGGAVERKITDGKTPVPFTGYRVQRGQFIYSRIDARNGAFAVVPDDLHDAVVSKDFPVFDIHHDRVVSSYLAHYFRAGLVERTIQAQSRGATNRQRITEDQFLAIPIALPPLTEQRRIATILDHADTLRAKRRQALAHLDSLPQAIFHRMFGDPDDATAAVPFGDIATLSGGRNLVADDSSADSAYRVLKISAVTTGQFRPEESKPLPSDYTPPTTHLVRQGDLLMSRANTAELVGAVAYVHSTPDSLALPDKVWRFAWRDPHSSPLFYQALMQTPTIRRRISRLASGTGGSMKNISKAKLDQMPVPHVEICRQQEFARLVCDVKQRRAKTVAAVATHDALFASLQTRAFKGEL